MKQNTGPGVPSVSEQARALEEEAVQARRDGLEQQAYECYARSLALYRVIEDRAGIVRVLIRISHLSGWADFGDGLDMFTRRQRIVEEVLPLARELGDKALLADALGAFSAAVSGENAVAMLEESAALSTEIGDDERLAYALMRLANTMSLQRDYKRARLLNERAIRIYRRIGDKAGEASVLFSMSIRAPKPTRRRHLERALELQRALGNKRRMAEILSRLDAACQPGDLDKREAYNREGLELCRQFGSPIWEAGHLDNLAEIARLRGDVDAAAALEEESRSVYQPPPVDPAAEKAFEEALTSGDVEQITEAMKKLFSS